MAIVRTRSWGEYLIHAAKLREERGVAYLLRRVLRALTAPLIDWGSVTFFECRLDTYHAAVPALAGVEVREASAADLPWLLAGADPDSPVDALAQRLQQGDRCFAAADGHGQAAHVRWVATRRVRIPEIGREVVPRAGEAYFYNGYTRPDARCRGIDGLVRSFIFHTLARERYTRACSYVRGDNLIGLRAAARWQHPCGTVRYVRILGFKLVIGSHACGMPTLSKPVAGAQQRDRAAKERASRQWFQSWLAEPLAKRSTGCSALPNEYFRSAASHIASALSLDPSSDDVLDVGCDSAMISRLITPHCRCFVGIDFIPAMLTPAAGHCPPTASGRPARFVAGDGRVLPIRSRSFSKVYCSAVIHTLASHEDGLLLLDELVRVCAPGGTVLVSSIPDRAKRFIALHDIWTRGSWLTRLTLPIRLLIPRPVKRVLRTWFGRPSRDPIVFLEHDLRALHRRFAQRGLRCEILDFPPNYWSVDFRRTRSNLLIHIPSDLDRREDAHA